MLPAPASHLDQIAPVPRTLADRIERDAQLAHRLDHSVLMLGDQQLLRECNLRLVALHDHTLEQPFQCGLRPLQPLEFLSAAEPLGSETQQRRQCLSNDETEVRFCLPGSGPRRVGHLPQFCDQRSFALDDAHQKSSDSQPSPRSLSSSPYPVGGTPIFSAWSSSQQHHEQKRWCGGLSFGTVRSQCARAHFRGLLTA